MLCSEFQQRIEGYLDRHFSGDKPLFERHASSCSDCAQRLASERQFRGALQNVSVPAPKLGFESRILVAATQSKAPRARPQTTWPGWALAASVLVTVTGLFFFQVSTNPRQSDLPGQFNSGESIASTAQSVRLMIKAPRALAGAQLRLELPDGAEFVSYQGQKVLEWTADLVVGQNLLEIPVRSSRSGMAVATISYRGAQRKLLVPVSPAVQFEPENHKQKKEYQYV